MNIQEVLKDATNILKNANIETFKIDAEVILMDLLKIDKIKLLTSNLEISEEQKKNYFDKIAQRKNCKPVSYITNKAYFMDYEFYVDERVLIPRNDTEILIELAYKFIKEKKYKSILDIGTGSGCIPISLTLLTDCKSYAIDISSDALDVAKINAKKYNLNEKIVFVNSNLFENFFEKVDVLISNPPYINKQDMSTLMKDVVDFEPHNALYGGIDGLDFYRKIIDNSKNFINENGMIFFEIGYDQGEDVKKLLLDKNFKNVEIEKDYKGFDRVVYGIM